MRRQAATLGALAVLASAIGCATLIGLDPSDKTVSGSTTTTTGTAGGPTSCADSGPACTASSECSTGAGTLCVVASCTAGCCEVGNASRGATCSDNGGTVCDGNGNCVACNQDSDCGQSTTCRTFHCDTSAHTCSSTTATKGTTCTAADGGTGDVCDGNGSCVAAHCADGIKDADETGVDCGGGSCTPCPDGQACLLGRDCVNKVCSGATSSTAGTCSPPTCDDGVQNGNETDIDCGGTAYADPTDAGIDGGFTACPKCPDKEHCSVNSDCQNDFCFGSGPGTCVSCGDGVQDGNETGIDCGGPQCDAKKKTCGTGVACATAADCTSQECTSNGNGGLSCSVLSNGAACTAAVQCSSGFCVDGYCCNLACTSACRACAASLTGSSNGVCAIVSDGSVDPRASCATTARSTCGTDGTCSAGLCHEWASGTTCASCTSGTATTGTCNGSGMCNVGTTTACAPYQCGATACETTCTSHADCVAGDFCWLGACVTLTSVTTSVTGGFACAVTSAGNAQCWGDNTSGQLGNGSLTSSPTPVAVSGLSGVTAISAGGGHVCAIASGGAWCWGNNNEGELGNGSLSLSQVPVQVTGLTSGVVAISAGETHTCALTSAGRVQCWGYNASGELGYSGAGSQVPVAVSGLTGVAAISAGAAHTCAVTTAGGVLCWGDNTNGELGDGSTTSSATPVSVSSLSSGVRSVTAGYYFTCGLTTAGAPYCWGRNTAGQLGDGSTTQRNAPVKVANLNNSTAAISAGFSHTCVLPSTAGALCWGDNTDGELGNNSTTASTAPVIVSGLSGLTSIAAGEQFSCAVTTGGGATCWGRGWGLVPFAVSEP